ncbi:MAG: hypothetical protein J5819_07855 [Eubacterium sp.]|nr:hypothetical protein [Eubacterium sp.]
MDYVKAAKGAGKIFAGEILLLFGTILTGASTLVTLFASASATSVQEAEATLAASEDAMDYISKAFHSITDAIGSTMEQAHAAIVAGIITLLATVLFIIGMILFMVGVAQAAADESLFLRVIYIMIGIAVVELLFKIITPYIVPGVAQVVELILDSIIILLDIYSSFEIVHAFRNIADKLSDEIMVKRGAFAFKVGGVMLVISLITTVIGGIVSEEISGVFSVIAIFAQALWYIVYMMYVGRSRTMLHKHVKASEGTA